MPFTGAPDTISGREGRIVYKQTGQTPVVLAYAKNINATFDKQVQDVNILGQRATQHKATGWSGSGTMTLYKATTRFRRIIAQYINTGQDLYFDLQVENNDPTSKTGKEMVTLRSCNIGTGVLASLDADNAVLDEELAFTYDGYSIDSAFTD